MLFFTLLGCQPISNAWMSPHIGSKDDYNIIRYSFESQAISEDRQTCSFRLDKKHKRNV